MHLSFLQAHESFYFPEIEKWIFGIFMANQPTVAFLPLQASKLRD
jgi:hypothetical protein